MPKEFKDEMVEIEAVKERKKTNRLNKKLNRPEVVFVLQ
jgi:hypothetical protein